MKTIREARKELGFTQVEAAKATNVSRRTFQNYEALDNKEAEDINEVYDRILKLLENYRIDENHGYVTVKEIKNVANIVFRRHKEVKCAYLFGSYARGEAKPTSDVDILVVIKGQMGLDYYGMAYELEELLHKKIDLVSHRQIVGSEDFLERLLREGVKIYGHGTKQVES